MTGPLVQPAGVVTVEFRLHRSQVLTLNQRHGHWGVRASRAATIRALAAYAKLDQAPDVWLPAAACVCLIEFPNRHRRDIHNWTPTAKAGIDGMVNGPAHHAGRWLHGLLDDDSGAYLTGPDMREGHDPDLPGSTIALRFTFTEIEESI